MRNCTVCGIEKPDTEFYSAGKGYLRGECKPCKVKKELVASQKRRQKFREWKSTLVCERCGFDDPRALQFHHKDDNKEFAIANRISSYSLQTILKEAEKCEVLCANCHQIEHTPD